MIPAIWTGILAEEPLPQALRALAGLGWRAFELSTEHIVAMDQDPEPKARVDETVQVLADLGAVMPQAHALLGAEVAHPDPERRRADLETLERHLRLCAGLGVRVAVIHPGNGGGTWTTGEGLRRLRALNIEAFTRLGDLAEELGVAIGIENTMDVPARRGRAYGAYPHELRDLIATVGSPALGITLDTSHANCQRLDLPAAVREIGDRLLATHISDNDGSGDQHRMPGIGKIDWLPLAAALREIGYGGLFDLEIPGERHPVREILEMKLRHAREVTEWLVGG